MPPTNRSVFIHSTAIVEEGALIGEGTKIWAFAQVRAGAEIGARCIIGKGVFVDSGVKIGSDVKIQNSASLYHGVEIADGVFIGPHVCFTNDKLPRAINPDGSIKSATDWQVSAIKVEYGVSIGANSTIVPGIVLGTWAMIAAGAVVTRSVPAYALMKGSPARACGVVAPSGEIISRKYEIGEYRSAKDDTVLSITKEMFSLSF